MSILNLPVFDLVVILGLLALVIILFILASCVTSSKKTRYERMRDDEEQMQYIKECRERKEHKK